MIRPSNAICRQRRSWRRLAWTTGERMTPPTATHDDASAWNRRQILDPSKHHRRPLDVHNSLTLDPADSRVTEERLRSFVRDQVPHIRAARGLMVDVPGVTTIEPGINSVSTSPDVAEEWAMTPLYFIDPIGRSPARPVISEGLAYALGASPTEPVPRQQPPGTRPLQRSPSPRHRHLQFLEYLLPHALRLRAKVSAAPPV